MKRSTEKLVKWVGGLGLLGAGAYLGYEKWLPAKYKVKVGKTVTLEAGNLQTNAPIAVAQHDVMSVLVTRDGGNVWNGNLQLAGATVPVPVSFPKTADVVSVS